MRSTSAVALSSTGWKSRMKDESPRRESKDEVGDSFPNDILEAAILFVVGLGIFGSVIALYHLSQQLS